MELLRLALGEYFEFMDTRHLTEKISPVTIPFTSSNYRACIFDGCKPTDEINPSFIKMLTCGDSIITNAQHKEPIYNISQMTPFLLCNYLPNIDSDNDEGIWRLIRVIHFPSKFVKHSDITGNGNWPSNYFIADSNLSHKLKDWQQTFMGMLIVYHRKYKKAGLMLPKLVRQHTIDYRKHCNSIKQSDVAQKNNENLQATSLNQISDLTRNGIPKLFAETKENTTIIPDDKIKNGRDLPKLIDAHGKIMIENNAELAVLLFEETETIPEIKRIYINRFQIVDAYIDNILTNRTFEHGIYIEIPQNKKDVLKVRCHMLVKHETTQIVIDLQKFYDTYYE